jgi:hypothetical protein
MEISVYDGMRVVDGWRRPNSPKDDGWRSPVRLQLMIGHDQNCHEPSQSIHPGRVSETACLRRSCRMELVLQESREKRIRKALAAGDDITSDFAYEKVGSACLSEGVEQHGHGARRRWESRAKSSKGLRARMDSIRDGIQAFYYLVEAVRTLVSGMHAGERDLQPVDPVPWERRPVSLARDFGSDPVADIISGTSMPARHGPWTDPPSLQPTCLKLSLKRGACRRWCFVTDGKHQRTLLGTSCCSPLSPFSASALHPNILVPC